MSKEAMKQALEALEKYCTPYQDGTHPADEAIIALREALAEPDFWEGYVPEPVKPAQQEPVGEVGEIDIDEDGQAFAWLALHKNVDIGDKLYTSPPAQRTWVGLTDEELSEVYNQADWDTVNGWEYERAIEAKLKEKNGL